MTHDIYRPRIIRALALALLVVSGVATARAQFTSASVSACANTVPTGGICNIVNDRRTGISPSLSASYSTANGNLQMSVNNAAVAKFGVLHASASENFTISGSPLFTRSEAEAEFDEIMTISFAPFNGQPGLLFVQNQLIGTTTAAGKAQNFGFVDADVIGLGPGLPPDQFQPCFSGADFTGVVAGMFPCPLRFHFIFGQPFELVIGFSALGGTYTLDATGACCVPGTAIGQGSGTANFSNTLVLSGLDVSDANGNPLPSAPTITAASGTAYSADGILKSFDEFRILHLGLSDDQNTLQMQGRFKLGASSSGIDPLTQDVGFQVGNFSTGIPAGSFQLRQSDDADEQGDEKQYTFVGTVNGVALDVVIRPIDNNEFKLQVKAQGANLVGTTNPVKAKLIIGLDGGSAIGDLK